MSRLHLASIARLPLARRILHPVTLRHLIAIALGMLVISIGMGIVHASAEHSAFGEAIGWLIHAFGMTPILAHIDPLWTILLGTALKE